MACDKCNTTCDSNCNCTVRYTGPDIDCLGITSGDSFDTVLSKMSNYICDINFEDGVGIENMTYDSATDDFEVTLTDGTVYNFTGLQGDDGQSVDHTSFTSSTGGGAASQPGETDTYTVWGDAGETVNLGTFTVYNGDEVNTTNVFDAIYDSGWKQLPDYNGTFGLPAVSGFSHPFIRVVDRTVFLVGNLILPLGSDGNSSILNSDRATYPSSGTNLFSGNAGGYDISNSIGGAVQNRPMMPAALQPDRSVTILKKHQVRREIISAEERALAGNGGQAILSTVLNSVYITSDGKLGFSTQKDLDDTVNSVLPGSFTELRSDLSYQNIQKFSSGDPILKFDTMDHTATATNGYPTYTSIDTGNTYPFPFDGRDPIGLGGFSAINLNYSYPLSPTTTLTDIQNAIASW